MDSHQVFQFAGYLLDVTRGCLRTVNRDIELRPKTFELMRYLVEHGGRLVSKDEIFRTIWPNVIVTDDSIKQCVSELRVALGDEEQRIIKTVPRRGYVFVAPVLPGVIDGVGSAPAASPVRPEPPKYAAVETTGLPFPDQPSIAVLPFTNMSGDAQQDYFSDGITEDLTTRLSKFGDLFVIASHSALRYKGPRCKADRA
jgi:DNA-binding winged helix-turn-helix (wHTH) protein